MKRAVFVGQAMPRNKKDPHDWKSLNSWLYSINLTDNHIKQHFCYSALVDYFPGARNGSHRVPTPHEIKKEKQRLFKTITDFSPDIVVPIGKLSISCCLNRVVNKLEDFVGKKYSANPYQALNSEITVIPFPHPSGASTWRYRKENFILLQKALKLLKSELLK